MYVPLWLKGCGTTALKLKSVFSSHIVQFIFAMICFGFLSHFQSLARFFSVRIKIQGYGFWYIVFSFLFEKDDVLFTLTLACFSHLFSVSCYPYSVVFWVCVFLLKLVVRQFFAYNCDLCNIVSSGLCGILVLLSRIYVLLFISRTTQWRNLWID